MKTWTALVYTTDLVLVSVSELLVTASFAGVEYIGAKVPIEKHE